MGTRGLYGFRMGGVEKFTYNHYDSYPDGLGAEVANFCESTSIEQMKDIFNRIVMVKESDTPTPEQIEACKAFTNTSVGRQSDQDWYCLLRELQGELSKLKEIPGDIFMIDNHDFIKDSLFCEYAYIIDLDREVLEYWIGFQRKPWEDNPYGCDVDDGYYPCRKYAEFELGEDAECVVDQMNHIDENQEAFEDGARDICALITEAADSVGWTAHVGKNGNYHVEFSNSSPEGEDLEYEYEFDTIEDLYDMVYDEYSDFDCDQHVYDLLMAYRRSRIPGIRSLCDDAEEIASMLKELADAIKKLI